MKAELQKPNELSSDEWRLVRLFRCLDTAARSEVLRETAARLLTERSLDPYIHLSKDPELSATEEIAEDLEERLKRAMPYDSYLAGLRDYDFDFVEVALDGDIVKLLLGTSDNDDWAADSLVYAYIDGANQLALPLPADFDVTPDEMRNDLKQQALKFIRSWREQIVEILEKAIETRKR